MEVWILNVFQYLHERREGLGIVGDDEVFDYKQCIRVVYGNATTIPLSDFLAAYDTSYKFLFLVIEPYRPFLFRCFSHITHRT